MIYSNIKKNTLIFFFGHRGAPNLFRENSIQSIEKAIELGCHGVEIDIQLTSDNQIILFHDYYIIDQKNRKQLVNDISYKEIKNIFDKKNIQAPDTIEDLIPLMKDNPNIVFNLEIKSLKIFNNMIIQAIIDKIPSKILKKQCIISSFNYFLIAIIKLFYCNYSIAMILKKNVTRSIPRKYFHLALIRFISPNFVHPHFSDISTKFITWVHKQNIKVNTYTVNDEKELRRCIKLDVDGVFTDTHSFYCSKK